MTESIYEALLGALLRVNEDRLRYPLSELVKAWLRARGLEDYEYRLIPLMETLYRYRILRDKRWAEIGFTIGKKNIPLSFEDILKELLR